MRAWCPASFAQSWRQLRIRRFDLVHFSVRAGQRFLVFSNLEGGFDAMMGSPLNAVLVTGEDDAVGDTEMVLASAALPVASQAHAMATALGAAGGPQHLFRRLGLGSSVRHHAPRHAGPRPG